MSQEVASKIIYGNTADDPEEFMGLAPRFNDTTAANGGQIIDAGGTGSDNTSVWFVTWGDNQCQLLYPKGTQAGVQREDHGEQRVTDDNGNAYYAKEEKFTWHVGLAVKDWRYVSRIANIDVSEMLRALLRCTTSCVKRTTNCRIAASPVVKCASTVTVMYWKRWMLWQPMQVRLTTLCV